MPSLRKITCQVLWPEGTPFKEYATTYGDGIVETFIAVPSDKPQRFSIRVTSKGYIYEGLTAVVFIDGVYQCNRNRINLVRPKKNIASERTEIDFCMRQEERKLKDDGYFLGSDWRFDNFNTVNEAPKTVAKEQFDNLGTIDVIVLRCCARKGDNTAEDDCDSAAESDVLGNKLTEEEDDGTQDKRKKGNDRGATDNKDAKDKNDKKKNGGKGAPKDDEDEDTVSIVNVDGAADGYYGRPSYPGVPSWTDQRSDAHHYGPPPFGRGQRHVHFDMGPDVSHPPNSRYVDHHDIPHTRASHIPGLSQHRGHHTQPPYSHDMNHISYPVQPHPIHPFSQGKSTARGIHNAGWCARPPHPQYPFQLPMNHNPAAWPAAAQQSQNYHQEPPQPTLNWVEPQAPKASEQTSNDHAQTTNQAQQSSNAQPPAIDPYSGYYWDTNGWRPAIVGVSKEAMASIATNGQNGSDGNASKDDWGSTPSNTTQTAGSGWGDAQTNNDNTDTSKNDDWDKSKDNDKNNSEPWGNSDSNQNNNTSSNDASWNNTNNDGNKSTSGGDSWGNNDNSKDNQKPSSPGTVPNTLHGPHGAYHGPRIAVQPNGDTPWVSDEPPRYDVPEEIVNAKQLSKQVQRGRAYNYYKRHRKPIYVDSVEEPYARFVFKYRTKDKLPKGLKIEPGFEPTPDQATQDLQDKKKEELIAELLRFKMAYGEAAPEVASKATKGRQGNEEQSDATEWEADPPANSFLQYKLPPHYGDTGAVDPNGDDTATNNGSSESKPDDNPGGWGVDNNNNTSSSSGGAGNGWDNANNSGGSGGGGKAGW